MSSSPGLVETAGRRHGIAALCNRLARLTGYTWLVQVADVRIDAPADRRFELRAEIERALSLLRGARSQSTPEARALLAQAALQTLIGGLESVDAERAPPSESLLTRVAASLPSPALAEAFAEFGISGGQKPSTQADYERLRELCEWSFSLLDTRTPRERQVWRWGQLAALVLGVSAVAYAVFSPKNLALRQPVALSSECGIAPPPPYARPQYERAVDGVEQEIPFAVCTGLQVHPWLSVDLGGEHSVSEVVVHNRNDCCWGVDDTPLSVQLSSDNQNFVTVATRSEPFTGNFPWRARFGSQRARYVRLTNASEATKNIVISEIEVYGH